jgi:hypothetical protein
MLNNQCKCCAMPSGKNTSKKKTHAFVVPHPRTLSFPPSSPLSSDLPPKKKTKRTHTRHLRSHLLPNRPRNMSQNLRTLMRRLLLFSTSHHTTPPNLSPSCRASNLSGAIEKSIFACSLASAVMGLCFRPSVLDPSLME